MDRFESKYTGAEVELHLDKVPLLDDRLRDAEGKLTELESEVGITKVVNINNPTASSWQKTNIRVIAGIPYRFTCTVGRITGQRIMDGNSILESLSVNIPAVSTAVITFTQSGELLFYCVNEGEVEVSFYNSTGIKEDVSTLEKDVSTIKEDVSTLEKDVSTIKEDVSTLEKDVLGNKRILTDNGVETSVRVDEYIDTDNTWLGTNGQLGSLDSWFVREYTVEEGNKYQVHSFVYKDKVAIAFHDANGNVLDYIQGNSSTSASFNATVIAPKDAVKMYVQGFVQATDGQPNVELLKFILISPLKWSGKKWCVLGDSLTEVNTTATKRYHDYVSEVTGIEVYNAGLSGSGYHRKSNVGKAFYQRVADIPSDVDVITIFGSINDYGDAEIGNITDTTDATICGCVNLAIEALKEKFPLVPLGIVTPTPRVNTEPNQNNGEAIIAKNYADAIIAICKAQGVPYLDLWRCSQLHPSNVDFRDLAYSRDSEGKDGHPVGSHPDEKGHKLIAPRFKALLESLIL